MDKNLYGKQKVKPLKESITDLVATACEFNKEEILSNNDPTCQPSEFPKMNGGIFLPSEEVLRMARLKSQQQKIAVVGKLKDSN